MESTELAPVSLFYSFLSSKLHSQETQTQTEATTQEVEAVKEPTFEDFAKLDIRVGKITEVWKVFIEY